MPAEPISSQPRIVTLIGWFLGAIGSVMALASIAPFLVVRPADVARIEEPLPATPVPTGLPAVLSDIVLGNIREAAILLALLGILTVLISLFFLRRARWAYRGVAVLAWVHLLLVASALLSLIVAGISMIALLHGAESSTPLFIGVMLIVGGLTLGLIYGLPIVVVIRRLREPSVREAFEGMG